MFAKASAARVMIKFDERLIGSDARSNPRARPCGKNDCILHDDDPNGGAATHNIGQRRLFEGTIRTRSTYPEQIEGGIDMRKLILLTALIGAMSAPVAAEAKGCIKGAIVGGVAGHMAGHGKLGALAGCVIGHHEANKPQELQPGQQTPDARATR